MMLMAGGDRAEFIRIRDIDRFADSWRIHMLQFAASYSPPRTTDDDDQSGED